MLTLPVTAVCEIPEVIIDPSDELNFEKVYIRAETIKTIKLINTSSTLNAQFQILPQDETSKTWGVLTSQTDSGKIGPEETYNLNVCLVPNKLGPFRLKLEILCKTRNNGGNTTTINIKAHSIGPTVKVDKGLEELDFGNIHVLNTRKDKITLLNDNPIDATYTAFMKNVPNIFSIVNKMGVIPKKSTIDLEVLCRPDEAMRFAELLYIKIDEAEDIKLTLKAKGEGTTVVVPELPDTNGSSIFFGTIFTNKEYVKEIRFENRGRSKQMISWLKKSLKKNVRVDDKAKTTQNNNNNNANNKNKNLEEEEENREFFTLARKGGHVNARSGCIFKLIAFSPQVGIKKEYFQIQNYREGESSGGAPQWDNILVEAEFINPMLEYPKKLYFTYSYDKDSDVDFIKNNLTIKNISKLQAQFMISVNPPFSISKDKFTIEPNELDSLEVEFDPSSYKIKKEISNFISKLTIQHINHEQSETIDLVGKINFPNLTITPTRLDFGCLLNDTFKKNLITLENESEMDVIYEWFLVEEENSYEPTKNRKREGRKIPLNEVFGIIPMNGRLKKGEKEVTEISFSPGMNQKYYAKAKCCVEGGPEYMIDLVGEASEIKYKIVVNDQDSHDMNKREFNILFGEIPFNERSKLDMVIKNEGDVPFVYRINYNADKLRYMSISSIYDEIKAREFKKIEIEIIPGIPDTLDDELIIEIAHFEPIKVRIKAIGIYRGLILSMNRKEAEFKEIMMEAENRLESRKKKMNEYIPNYLIKKNINLNKKTGPTAVDKKNTLVQNSAIMSIASEHEMEVNRDILCKKLIEKMNKFEIGIQTGPEKVKRSNNPGEVRERQLNNFMKDIKISTYTLDFGNIVAGKKVELKFDISNFNKTQVNFSIERKELANLGYIISSNVQGDKFVIEPFSFITLNITHETNNRNLSFIKNIMKITMKDGETYEIELNSFVAIPDLKLSINEVKFDKVYIGRKKIMRFRIENITKVPVKWNIINRDPPSKKQDKDDKKEETEIFSIFPTNERLEPGKKKTITVSFVPQKAKNYKSRYEFIIDDNPRHIEFFLDGSGAELELKIIPESLNIGPVLPYYKYALDYVELFNPNDIDIEVYSLDFDEIYLQEEDMIRYYYSFIKHQNSNLDLQIRNAGEPIWKKFSNYAQLLNEKINEAKALKTDENENTPSQHNNQNVSKASGGKLAIVNEKDRLLEKLEIPDPKEELEIKIQPQIDCHLKYNVILIGPEKSGISSVLTEQRKFQFRGVVNLKNILEWNVQNEFNEIVEKVKIYLDEKKKELEIAKVEKDKAIKQAKAKKIKIDETPIDERKFLGLSKELMSELIKNRLSKSDCNVGAVFEDLNCDLIESEEFMLEVLEDVLKNENIVFAYFEYPQDENQMEVCNFVDWKGINDHFNKEKASKRQNESASVKDGVSTNEKNKQKANVAVVSPSKGKQPGKVGSSTQIGNLSSSNANLTNNGTNNNFSKTGGRDTVYNTNNKDKLNTTLFGKQENSVNALSHFYGGIMNIPNALDFTKPKFLTPEELEQYVVRKNSLIQKLLELKDLREHINNEKIDHSSLNINSEEKFFNKSVDDEMSKQTENVNFNASNLDSNKFEKSQIDGGNNTVHMNIINNATANNNTFNKLGMDNNTNNLINNNNNTNLLSTIHKNLERKITPITFEHYLPLLVYNFCKSIPNPKLPDPEDMPIPPDEEYQIIKRPNNRIDRPQITSFFLKALSTSPEFEGTSSIEEIVALLIEEDKRLDELKNSSGKDKGKPKPTPVAKNPKDPKDKGTYDEFKPKDILFPKSRWFIKKGESVKVLVGFFCKEVAVKPQTMSFEIMTYPPKEFKLSLTGISDYPSLSTMPSNIFMNKAKPGAIGLMNRKKNYEEDFGYILITKDSERKNIERYKDTNCRQLRFTNNGKFDLRVDFVFLSSLNTEGLGFNLFLGSNTDGMNSSHTTNMNKPKNTQPAVVEPPTPFLLTTTSFDIKKEETKLLQVYAFPQRTVEYKDILICLIKDNPTPIKINLTCKGAEPRVEVEPDFIDFEKLIINQTLPKQIKLKNISEVNCKWQLSGIAQVPPQFKFDATQGVVEKGKEQVITVTFSSDKQEKFNFNLTLDIEDNLNYGIKMPPRNIKVSAEAFKVNVDLVINSDNKVIDFGNVKVRDYKSFPFLLKNLGIYKIKYKFEINKKFWQELFKFEPNDGEIEPGKERNILACFLPYPRDINISPAKNGTEIKLVIYEGEKNIKDQEIPIFINVASYFSKYTISPLKIINFGSLQFNDSTTRSIEIRNEGQFDFVYELMEYLEESKMIKLKEEKDQREIEEQKQKELEMREALEVMGKGGAKGQPPAKKPNAPAPAKADDKKGGKKVDENALKINRFSLSNFKGVIAPGSSSKIDILFQAESNKFYNTVLAIDIQGRQPDDNPLGIPFDLVAESCIPSIDTKDFDNIFEEQTVLPSLNPDINRQSVITSSIYGIDERVFWFGTVIASKNPNGVTERFKILNSNKIPCTVKISVKPRTNSKSEGFAFEVAHKTPLKIYPNESEYVSVTFKPTSVMPYSALFEAIVEGGDSNPETGVLRFELRGEGTLPTIVLEQPQEYNDDGSAILRFKKTRLGKFNNNQIQLKNDGTVPATVKFDQILNECFAFCNPTTATIQPKNYQTFDIKFEPKSAIQEKAILTYKTLFNPYESPKIVLLGEGYFESISFENLQIENELIYGDICIGNSKTITFDMNNQSDTPYKFFWLNNLEPCLEITPAYGIILPKTTKTLIAVFSGKEPVKYSQKDLMIELKQIKFVNNIEDWDSNMKYMRKVTQLEYQAIFKKREEDKQKRKEEIETIITSMSGAGGKKAAVDNKKGANALDKNKKKEDELQPQSPILKDDGFVEIEEVYPEPQYSIIEKSEKYITLKLTAVSDYAKFQCQISQIRFKPTMMYGSRKHDFFIKNTSAMSIHYSFVFTNPNNPNPNANDQGPFSISPKQGVIPPNSDEPFLVRFSPIEVDDFGFKRFLICHMKDLDPQISPLQIELTGEAERPVCHFVSF